MLQSQITSREVDARPKPVAVLKVPPVTRVPIRDLINPRVEVSPHKYIYCYVTRVLRWERLERARLKSLGIGEKRIQGLPCRLADHEFRKVKVDRCPLCPEQMAEIEGSRPPEYVKWMLTRNAYQPYHAARQKFHCGVLFDFNADNKVRYSGIPPAEIAKWRTVKILQQEKAKPNRSNNAFLPETRLTRRLRKRNTFEDPTTCPVAPSTG